jgi:plastocyanin/heme-degrading monooxygenase HmoA
MEYVHQVSVLVAAAKLGDARALFDDLEAHRRELRGLRGFVSMSVGRSVETGGDTLVSIETRWKDESALHAYLASARHAVSVIGGHSGITVADSLSTRRLESLDSQAPSKSSIVTERFFTALALPMVVLGIGLAIVYSLSRVYLEMGSDGAVPLAVIIAASIMLVAWYFAQNAQAPVWQMGAVGAAVVAMLIGGTVWAQVSPGPEHEQVHAGEPTPGATETPGATPAGDVLELHDGGGQNVFILNGQENPTLTGAAGQEVTLDLKNTGKALHNMHIAASGGFASAICNAAGADPCSDPARISGGKDGTITFNLPAGTYTYRCDFHTAEMSGDLNIQ